MKRLYPIIFSLAFALIFLNAKAQETPKHFFAYSDSAGNEFSIHIPAKMPRWLNEDFFESNFNFSLLGVAPHRDLKPFNIFITEIEKTPQKLAYELLVTCFPQGPDLEDMVTYRANVQYLLIVKKMGKREYRIQEVRAGEDGYLNNLKWIKYF